MTKNHVLLADFKWPCVGNHAFCINGNWNEGKPGDACDVTMKELFSRDTIKLGGDGTPIVNTIANRKI